MSRLAPLLLLFLAGCGIRASEPAESSVTVTLPPAKEAPAPGFSAPVTADIR